MTATRTPCAYFLSAQLAQEKLTSISTRRNQTASRFLRLPAELRNQIYSYALSGRRLAIEFGHPRRPYLLDFRDSQKNGPSLSRTCRQINSKMSTIPHTHSTLSLSHPLMLQKPLKRSGMLKTVTSLVLNTTENFTHYWFDYEFVELDDSIRWWNEASLTFVCLPLLETVQVFVVAEDWESTVHNPGGWEWKAERAIKLTYIAEQFAIWSAFVEKLNPGIRVTFGLRHTGIRKRRPSMFALRHSILI